MQLVLNLGRGEGVSLIQSLKTTIVIYLFFFMALFLVPLNRAERRFEVVQLVHCTPGATEAREGKAFTEVYLAS